MTKEGDEPEEEAEEAPAPRGVTRQDIFSVLGALGAIITLSAAVMFYFGWRRSDVQAAAMGIDVSLFEFSSQDYVLRSISSLYLPLLVVIAIMLGWVWCHGQVRQMLRGSWLRVGKRRATAIMQVQIVLIVAAVVAIVSLLFALIAGRTWEPWPVRAMSDALADRQWVVPFVLVLSTMTAAYAAWIRRQLVGRRTDDQRPLWHAVLPAALIVGTVTLGAFWLLEEYAASVGQDYARAVATNVSRMPRAVVLSPEPLGIEAPGVVEERATSEGGSAHYRTSGLRLLARSGDKLLLVHDGWTPATGTVIAVADRDELIWEFSR